MKKFGKMGSKKISLVPPKKAKPAKSKKMTGKMIEDEYGHIPIQ